METEGAKASPLCVRRLPELTFKMRLCLIAIDKLFCSVNSEHLFEDTYPMREVTVRSSVANRFSRIFVE